MQKAWACVIDIWRWPLCPHACLFCINFPHFHSWTAFHTELCLGPPAPALRLSFFSGNSPTGKGLICPASCAAFAGFSLFCRRLPHIRLLLKYPTHTTQNLFPVSSWNLEGSFCFPQFGSLCIKHCVWYLEKWSTVSKCLGGKNGN